MILRVTTEWGSRLGIPTDTIKTIEQYNNGKVFIRTKEGAEFQVKDSFEMVCSMMEASESHPLVTTLKDEFKFLQKNVDLTLQGIREALSKKSGYDPLTQFYPPSEEVDRLIDDVRNGRATNDESQMARELKDAMQVHIDAKARPGFTATLEDLFESEAGQVFVAENSYGAIHNVIDRTETSLGQRYHCRLHSTMKGHPDFAPGDSQLVGDAPIWKLRPDMRADELS